VYNDPSVITENIVIQRATGDVQLNGNTHRLVVLLHGFICSDLKLETISTRSAPAGRVPADEEVMTIYGILGFIRLLAGGYPSARRSIGKVNRRLKTH
jgi:hypothetical protein